MATGQVITTDGKKIALNRTFKTSPDYSAPTVFKVGTNGTSPSITQTDLLKLQQLKKESKLRLILIKEGIPFIPSFLLAYLFLELGGVDLIWRVVGG